MNLARDKTDEILNHVIVMKEDIAGIKEHLKTLNGKVIAHEQRIQENTKALARIDTKLAYYSGAIVVIIFLIDKGLKILGA